MFKKNFITEYFDDLDYRAIHYYGKPKWNYDNVITFWISRIRLILKGQSPFWSVGSAVKTVFWWIMAFYLPIPVIFSDPVDVGERFMVIAIVYLFKWITTPIDDDYFYFSRIRYKSLFIAMAIFVFIFGKTYHVL